MNPLEGKSLVTAVRSKSNVLTFRRKTTNRIHRRRFLKGVGALGASCAASPFVAGAASVTRPRPNPIQHVIVDMQENRSFDHYYGFAPWAGRYGVPNNYSQPNGAGGIVKPYHFTSLSTPDIGHSWNEMHAEYHGGAMDGFYTTNGINALGYYTAQDLPFYYSLFETSTLCANFFSSVMGPTWPN